MVDKQNYKRPSLIIYSNGFLNNYPSNAIMVSFFILGVLPALYWIWLFYISNRYKRASVKLLILLFVGGLLCGFLALTLNHVVEKYTMFWSESRQVILVWDVFPPLPVYQLGFWFLVGFNEEFAKLVVLLLLAYPAQDFREPFDGVLYAAVVAIGFATIENAFYVDQYGISILVTRTLITLPIHIFVSAPMGYYLAQAHFLREGATDVQGIYWPAVRTLLTGWAIAALLHAAYDAFLSLDFSEVAYLQLFLMGGMTYYLRRRSLQQSRLAPSNA